MPSLADIVAQLESGGGRFNASQPPSMVNPTYGQYSGFVNQYGSGPAGVNNFASQMLDRNPNATVGDFYASYVLGTGTPGQYNFSQLQSTGVPGAQGAANNFINNSGVSPDTPLSSFINPPNTLANGPVDNAAGFNVAQASTSYGYDPASFNNPTAAGQADFWPNPAGYNLPGFGNQPSPIADFGTTEQFSWVNPGTSTAVTDFGSSLPAAQPYDYQQAADNAAGIGTGANPLPSSTPDASQIAGTPQGEVSIADPSGSGGQSITGANITGAGGGTGMPLDVGLQSATTSFFSGLAKQIEQAFGGMTQTILGSAQSAVGTWFAGIQNWFVRGFLILLGIVIVLVALWRLLFPDQTKEMLAGMARLAAA